MGGVWVEPRDAEGENVQRDLTRCKQFTTTLALSKLRAMIQLLLFGLFSVNLLVFH